MGCAVGCGLIIGIGIIVGILKLIWEIPNPNSDLNRSFANEEKCPFCGTEIGRGMVKFNVWTLKEDCYHCDLCNRDISKVVWDNFNRREGRGEDTK